jgi:DNA-binding NtrC family response regulator
VFGKGPDIRTSKAKPAPEAMTHTVYVLEADPLERRWIEQALASCGGALVFIDDGDALFDRLPARGGDCLVCGAEPDAAAALELVRRLRQRGERLPVVVTGSHSAFRTAVDVARLEATDFIERPCSAQRLRAALRKVTAAAPGGAHSGRIEEERA